MSFLHEKIFKLKGRVQHYSWGGYEFIPLWLGVENAEHRPYAEYWMGTHPSASSDIITTNGEFPLSQLITDYPAEFIGEKAWKQFGELPYLFKILDVKDMLSIQVHPAKAAAALGFEAEEAAGIKISSASRNYKDKNHKPEVMIALSEFWLLHGFKKGNELMLLLKVIPEFAGLDELFVAEGYKGLYRYVMEMPQTEVTELLLPLVQKELKRKNEGDLTKEQPGWWVAKLYEGKNIANIDRGMFSIYFFNIVKLNPGEAIFQGAGVPHAYLEGQNVELMANSDNVLRGGLTPKHIDIPELMKHIIFTGVPPDVMRGNKVNEGENVYPCPVADFGISKISLKEGNILHAKANSLEIIVVINGTIELNGTNGLTITKGEAAAILAGENYTVIAEKDALAYKAFVP